MFFLASLVGVVFLYLVGFLILKGFKFSNLFALAAAPIVSTLCFEILAIVFDKLNHAASWAVFFVPSLLLGAALGGHVEAAGPLQHLPAHRGHVHTDHDRSP